MNTHSRFYCLSHTLNLKGLMARTRRALGLGFILTVGIHLGLAQLRAFEHDQKATKPLTVQFIKRQPRLSKPLELKKRPQPKRRMMRREIVIASARVDRQGPPTGLQPNLVIGRLARPRPAVRRITAFQPVAAEPQALAQAIQGSREEKQMVDMALEMMDVSALDTGQYHAMVIQDPADKRVIRGYFHFYRAYSVMMREGIISINWQYDARIDYGLGRLIRALNERTAIRSDLAGTIAFDDADLLKTPWVFAHTYYGFEVTESEASALGRYVMAGGFFFADAFPPATETLGPLDTSFRQLYHSALAAQGMRFGKDWQFERLPDAHPMYHCFFDSDGAPLGYSIAPTIRVLGGYLEGITIGGRLLGLMSNQCYLRTWSDYGPDGFRVVTRSYPEHLEYDNSRQLQLGINTIIFALTQEGSITHRVMDSVRY